MTDAPATPPYCPACQIPRKALARFCTGCGRGFGGGCPHCGVGCDDEDRYCRACGAALGAQSGLTAPVSQVTRPLSNRSGVFADERRTVTVVFADLSGFTAMSERLDPEEVKEVMDRCFAALSAVIVGEGGTVDKYIGDCIMAVFGAPVAHGDDPDRAVRAALKMQTCIAEGSWHSAGNADSASIPGAEATLRMRIGINTGKVLAGLLGEGSARDFTVMGDTVNLASRLEHAAPVDGILISRATRDALGDRFTLQPRPPLKVKGKTRPVDTWLVTGLRSGGALARYQESGPFIGRARWLAGLDQCYDAVCRGDRREGPARTSRRSPAAPGRSWHGPASGLRADTHRPAKAGEKSGLVLIGPAGVGKSRLLREWARRLELHDQPPLVLATQFLPEGAEDGLGPIRTLLAGFLSGGDGASPLPPPVTGEGSAEGLRTRLDAELGGALEADARDLVSYLLGAPLLNPALQRLAHHDPDQMASRLRHAFALTIEHLAKRRPVVLVGNDAHELSPLARGFFLHLAQVLVQAPVLLVLAARPPFDRDHADWIEALCLEVESLAPLSSKEARELLRQRAEGLSMNEAMVEALVERAEGNPLFLEELVETVRRQGVTSPKGGEAAPLPGRIEQVLQARIDGLDPEARDLLRYAAVCGRGTWRDFLEIVGGAGAQTALQRLGEAGMLVPAPTSRVAGTQEYVFRAPLLQEVAYENMPRSVRRPRHLALARWLSDRAQDDLHAQVAHHYEAGGLPQAALPAWQAISRRRFDVQAATQACRKLLEHSPDADLRASALAHLCDLARRRGSPDEALDHANALDAIGRQRPNAAYRAEAALQRSRAWEGRGDPARALSELDAAGELPDLAAAPRAELAIARAWVLVALGRVDEARGQAQDALQLAPDEHPELAAKAGAAWGAVEYYSEAYPEAADHFLNARAAFESLGDLVQVGNMLGNLGAVSLALKDFARAEKYGRESLALAERSGDLESAAASRFNLAGVARDAGHLDVALDELTRAEVLFTRVGNLRGLANVAVTRGQVLGALGRIEDALSAFAEAARRFREADDAGFAALAECEAAALLTAHDRHTEARVALERIGALRGELPFLAQRVAVLRIELYDRLARQEFDEARARLAQARAILGEGAVRHETALLLLDEGACSWPQGAIDSALTSWRQAKALAHDLGEPATELMALWRVALALARLGKAAEAAHARVESESLARRLAARITDASMAGEFLVAPNTRGFWLAGDEHLRKLQDSAAKECELPAK